MSEPASDQRALVVGLVDALIGDLSAGVLRYVGRRTQDDDADTFVLQDGVEGRTRLAWPDLSSPGSVVSMAQDAQRYLIDALKEPVPRCPVHAHPLDFVALDAEYIWACPDGEWRCGLGEYTEQAWPHFEPKLLASILGGRLKRRGITGVWSFSVQVQENEPVARITVLDLTPELGSALSDAAAPISVEVSERKRAPRRKIEPVAEAEQTKLDTAIRLVLSEATVRPGGGLGYTVVNDGDVPILTGVGFRLERQDDGWWCSVDAELIFPAIGLKIAPGRQRALTATVPARAIPGIYRLRKDISRDSPRPRTSQVKGDLPVELSAEFRVTDA